MSKKKFSLSLIALAITAAQTAYAADQVEQPKPVSHTYSIQRAAAAKQQVFKDGTTVTVDKDKLSKQLEDANWQNKNTKVGTGVDRALEKYGPGIRGNHVIVAVIDSGVDIHHPDLKNKIWVNKREKLDGMDNSGSGYVDDVNGWSFLGKNQAYANLEETRMYRDKTLAFRNDTSKLLKADISVKNGYEEGALKANTPEKIDYYYNLEFNPLETYDPDDASKAIRDYPSVKQPFYGNNDVIGLDASHGTHVAGIIAAKRGNGHKDESGALVTEGIAPRARIMPIRIVPNGDERDEDVANAVYYAVDNGARIINMSFGKGFSPQQKQVAKAIEYAASHGVLMIHAAGNSSFDIGDNGNFPNRFKMSDLVKEHWLEVGSTTKSFKRDEFVSPFSNFGNQDGKPKVDLFAPGSAIVSTIPGGGVASFNGTSMATPHVAGIAALVLSHAPELTGSDVKELLMDTVQDLSYKTVLSPDGRYVDFGSLSISGGKVSAINALNALYN